MRAFYNLEGEEIVRSASNEAPALDGWMAALQLNPARLVPDRQRMEQVGRSRLLISLNPRTICDQMRASYDDEESPVDQMDALIGADPFYDRFPWFRMIGRLAKAKKLFTIQTKRQ